MQTINLDLSVRSIIPLLHAKQGDVGRKFKAILTDGGAAYAVPAGAAVSVWYSGASGEGNYTDIGADSALSVSGNEITVELITQMLTNYGAGSVCLVINTADGDQLGTWSIPYMVEPLPGMGSAAAQAYFTAFSQAVANLPYPDNTLSVAGRAADAGAVGTALAGKAPAGYGLGEDYLPIVDKAGLDNWTNAGWCLYYDGVNPDSTLGVIGFVNSKGNNRSITSTLIQEAYQQDGYGVNNLTRVGGGGTWQPWEWVNPPMLQEQEYRTTERLWGRPVYKKLFYYGILPTGQSNANHGITGLSQVKKVTLLSHGVQTYLDHNPSITQIDVDAEKIYITNTNNALYERNCFVLIEYVKD